MSKKCACCNHPGRELIDAFCLNRVAELPNGELIRTALELIDVLAGEHPDHKPPSEASISKHGANHIIRSTALQLIDGNLCDYKGKALPGYGVRDVLRAAINLGFMNILEHPEKVTMTQMIDAIRLLAQIDGGTKDKDEYERVWSDLVRSSEDKRNKRKAKRVKDDTVDDDIAIEGEYQGS